MAFSCKFTFQTYYKCADRMVDKRNDERQFNKDVRKIKSKMNFRNKSLIFVTAIEWMPNPKLLLFTPFDWNDN